MNKEKMKSLSYRLVLGVLGVLALGSVVSAFSGNAQNVIEACSGCTVGTSNSNESLGTDVLGSANRIPHGYLDTADGYYVDGVVRIDGTGAATLTTTTLEGLVTGGSVLSTTTMGTATTLGENDLLYYSRIEAVANVTADHTFTFPASSTLTSFLPNPGDSKAFTFYNNTSTAGTDHFFTSGVGTYLEFTSSSKKIFPTSTAQIGCVRKVNTDIECVMTPSFGF